MDGRQMGSVRNKKKGYLKIHVAVVNIKTKEILALEMTDDEKVHMIPR
jgi:curli biogenesis system outer membrane secretion channel CsgG